MNIRQLSSRVEPGRQIQPARMPSRQAGPGKPVTSFDQTLEKAHQHIQEQESSFRLSAHALQRLEERKISLTHQERIDLGQAISRLHDKGARNALVVRSDAAFVVNVPNRTLVTAISQQELQQRVFTQIDSTVLI